MKALVIVLMLLAPACSATRVLVKDCHEVRTGLEECELVTKI